MNYSLFTPNKDWIAIVASIIIIMSISAPQFIIRRLLAARPLTLSSHLQSRRCMANSNDGLKGLLSPDSRPDRKAEREKHFSWLEKKGLSLDSLDVNSVFKLFNLEPKYKINLHKLRREMVSLQKVSHPDKFNSATLTTADQAGRLSAFINDFYNILKDPYLRGKFLLGIETDKNEIEIDKELDKVQLDEQFLIRMMDLREKIAHSGHDQIARHKINHLLQTEIDQLVEELNSDFEAKDYENVKMKLGKMKFLVSCQKACQDTGPAMVM